ncbi:MAG: hypothetical protein ABJF50_17185 [Paracoccaceae bacterium]
MGLSEEERRRESERTRIQNETTIKTAWGIYKKFLLIGCAIPLGIIFLLMLVGLAA